MKPVQRVGSTTLQVSVNAFSFSRILNATVKHGKQGMDLVARFVLGTGDSGNFPAAFKATAKWFPSQERALATGIFNSGTNIGATIAPFAVGFVVYRMGWQYAFLVTSGFAAVWVLFWLRMYESPAREKRLTKEEKAYINSGPAVATTPIRWASLLSYRQTWAFVAGNVLMKRLGSHPPKSLPACSRYRIRKMLSPYRCDPGDSRELRAGVSPGRLSVSGGPCDSTAGARDWRRRRWR